MIAILKAGARSCGRLSGDARLGTLIDEVDLSWWIADASAVHGSGDRSAQNERSGFAPRPAQVAHHSGVDITSIDLEAESVPAGDART